MLTVKLATEDLNCPHCGAIHRDIDEWALRPHRTHLCLHCNQMFEGTFYAVSRPTITPNYRKKLIDFNAENIALD